MRYILFSFFTFFALHANAKLSKPAELHVSVSAIRPAFPLTKFYGILADGPIHSMIEFGATYNWNQSTANQWMQQIHVGFAYHRFLQSMLPVYTDLIYMRTLSQKKPALKLGVSLGAGYLHSFPLTDQFEWKNGKYTPVGQWGRSQAMLKLGAFIAYKQFKIGYNNIIQTPYVKSYVPLMPYNNLTLTYSMPYTSFKTCCKKASNESK